MREDGLDLRGEDKDAVGDRVVEGVDAELVSRQQESPGFPVVEGEGELTVQSVEEVESVFLVQVEQHLDIALAAEAVPPLLQLAPQLSVVENLAVADDDD